jgi:hypothetical protein
MVLFGDTPSPAVQCWNANTLVVVLPPAQVAGPVMVRVKGVGAGDGNVTGAGVFVYKDGEYRREVILCSIWRYPCLVLTACHLL